MDSVFMKRVSMVQNELKAPKGQYNSFGKYKYRSCEDILEAAKPLCAKNNLVLNLSDEVELIGSRFYVKATATILDAETGESLRSTAYAREDETKKGMDGSQITGTASSYARKYALNGLLNIDDTKDADTDEYKNQQSNAPKEQKYICEACGSEIYSVKKKDGSDWSPADMYKYSGKRYGMHMCAACMKAADKAQKEAERTANKEPENGEH